MISFKLNEAGKEYWAQNRKEKPSQTLILHTSRTEVNQRGVGCGLPRAHSASGHSVPACEHVSPSLDHGTLHGQWDQGLPILQMKIRRS